jgi:hypothetical protein
VSIVEQHRQHAISGDFMSSADASVPCANNMMPVEGNPNLPRYKQISKLQLLCLMDLNGGARI